MTELEYYKSELSKVESDLKDPNNENYAIIKDRQQQLLGKISQLSLSLGVENIEYLSPAQGRVIEV
jgi:hypothetical protein